MSYRLYGSQKGGDRQNSREQNKKNCVQLNRKKPSTKKPTYTKKTTGISSSNIPVVVVIPLRKTRIAGTCWWLGPGFGRSGCSRRSDGDVNQCSSLNLGQQFHDESVAKEIFTANGERLRRARKNADVDRVNLRQDVEPSGVEI